MCSEETIEDLNDIERTLQKLERKDITMCKEDVCFNCDIRENCDHVSHRDIWDCNCRVATMKECDSQSIAEIAYDKLFDRFRGKEVI